MTFSIGIRTMPRPGVDYCRQTLSRLVEVGALQDQHVKGLHVHHGEGLTPNQNAIGALRLAARDDADWVLFLEDDIDVIDDFIGGVSLWLDTFVEPKVHAYPLGCFYSDAVRARLSTGVYRIPIQKYYGSQAVAFRTEDALHYGAWLARINFDTAFDIHLGRWHTEIEPEQDHLLTPAPCFVDHIGEQSLMGTWSRTGRMLGFAGREYRYGG